ncbi:MAG: Valine-tRNA ligase, partial [Parcubacteria group bacterium GW2011_GWC1_41_7]
MRADEISAMQRMRSKASEKDTLPTQRKQSLADKKIIAQFNATKLRVEKHIQLFQFSDALKLLYEFFWHDFCDVYVESCKGDTTNDPKILMQVLEQSLKLIHPFMPFVTDALAQKLQKKHLPLFTQPWPTKL